MSPEYACQLWTVLNDPRLLVFAALFFLGPCVKAIPYFTRPLAPFIPPDKPVTREWMIPFILFAVGILLGFLLFGTVISAIVGGVIGLAVVGVHQLPKQWFGRAGVMLASLALAGALLSGCATPAAGPKPTLAETVQGAEAWIEANILPGLPGLVAGGVVIAGNELIKTDEERQLVAGEVYAVAALVRSLMGGNLPDSVALRRAIESAGGGGPLLDLTAIADLIGGFVDPYLKQVQGDPNVRFGTKFLEAIASGCERGAALILKRNAG